MTSLSLAVHLFYVLPRVQIGCKLCSCFDFRIWCPWLKLSSCQGTLVARFIKKDLRIRSLALFGCSTLLVARSCFSNMDPHETQRSNDDRLLPDRENSLENMLMTNLPRVAA